MAWYNAISRLVAPPERVTGPAVPRAVGPQSTNAASAGQISGISDALKLENSRRGYYGDYDQMEAEAPEAKRSLDAFADNAIQPGEDGRPVKIEYLDEGAGVVLEEMFRRTGLLDRAWEHFRSTRKFGDHFVQLTFASNGSLMRVQDLPVREIRRNFVGSGGPNPVDFPWSRYDNHGIGKRTMDYHAWQIVQWGDVPAGEHYGFKRSQLAAGRRPWKALEMAQNAMLAERVQHTGTRLLFSVNVSGMTTDEAIHYMDEVKRDYAFRQSHDASTGKRTGSFDPMTAIDDIWLPWTKDGPAKPVDVIRFGAEIGEIADVKFLYGRFISSLEVPRYEIGLDEELRSRAATTIIDAAYLRRIVRVRQIWLRGFIQICNRTLYAAGYDEALLGDYRNLYTATFPHLRLIDEKLKWEICKLQAEVARIYGLDLGVVGPRFILVHFLGIPEREVDLALEGSLGVLSGPADGRATGEAVFGAGPRALSDALGPERAAWLSARLASVGRLSAIEARSGTDFIDPPDNALDLRNFPRAS